MSPHRFPLGARRPDDDEHVRRYPLLPVGGPEVGRRLTAQGYRSELPGWHRTHDQGWQPSCVGHALTMERAITNLAQRRAKGRRPFTVRFDPMHTWRAAKAIDEWPESTPDDELYGTSARAGYDVLRDQGAVPCRGMQTGSDGRRWSYGAKPLSLKAGVENVNRWCRNATEVVDAFNLGYKAVALGVPWYEGFEADALVRGRDAQGRTRSWLRPDPGDSYRGFHEVCLFGADDRLQAFWLKNSWPDWGEHSIALMPYAALDACFAYWADAAVVTDR